LSYDLSIKNKKSDDISLFFMVSHKLNRCYVVIKKSKKNARENTNLSQNVKPK